MLKIFVNLEKYNPVYSFNTWVYTIARNHCLNFVRKHVLPVEAERRSLRTEAPGPEGTVKSRLNKIRTQFKQALEAYCENR